MDQMALIPPPSSIPSAPLAVTARAAHRAPFFIADLVSKELARRHPGHLAEYVFGLKPEPFHWEWLELALNGDRGVLKAARGHAKSTYFSIILPLWLIGCNPNIRIAICSASAGQAEKYLREVGETIEYSAAFRGVFGNLFDPNALWTQKQKTVKRSKLQKDATIIAVGVGTGFAGARTDWIVMDDLVDDTNSLTVDRRRKVMTWLRKTALPTLDPTGLQTTWLIGTPYHFDDAVMQQGRVWPCYEYPAERDGAILWPSRFSREELDRRRAESTDYEYSTQYLVTPVGSEGSKLWKAWLHASPMRLPANSEEVWGLDWAATEAEDEEMSGDHDWSAIAKYRIAPWGLELFDMVRVQMEVPDVVAFLRDDLNPRVRKIGAESTGIGKVGIDLLKRLTGLPLYGIGASGKKAARFGLMAVDYAEQRITIAQDATERVQVFVNEWVGFPFYSHDDTLDAADLGRRVHYGEGQLALGVADA